MTVRELKEDYKHKAIFWVDSVIDLAYKNLVNYIVLLNGGIIFNDKEED